MPFRANEAGSPPTSDAWRPLGGSSARHGRAAETGGAPSFLKRGPWRPLTNSASRKAVTQALAVSSPTRRAPRAMTLASLCSRLSAAEMGSLTSAQRQAAWRLTAMAMPAPRAAERDAALGPSVRDMLGKLVAIVGVIDPRSAIRTQVRHLIAFARQPPGQFGLQFERGMIRSDGDAHGIRFLVPVGGRSGQQAPCPPSRVPRQLRSLEIRIRLGCGCASKP